MFTLLILATLSQPLILATLSQPLQTGPLQEDQGASPERFVTLLNQYRSRKLSISITLSKQAQHHAEVMASSHSFNHSFLIKGLPTPSGENIARGQRSSKELLHDWFTSPGHTRTMLDPRFTKAGVGLSQASNGVWYWSLQLEP